MTKKAKRKGIEIGAGLFLYLIALAAEIYGDFPAKLETVLFLLSYTAAAATTYWEQIRKITKRQFWDENLLMMIATVGAFLVNRHREAVAAMLFYQVASSWKRSR